MRDLKNNNNVQTANIIGVLLKFKVLVVYMFYTDIQTYCYMYCTETNIQWLNDGKDNALESVDPTRAIILPLAFEVVEMRITAQQIVFM